MTGDDVKQKFDKEWGTFRRFISANPLTGFWIGVAFGTVVVAGILRGMG